VRPTGGNPAVQHTGRGGGSRGGRGFLRDSSGYQLLVSRMPVSPQPSKRMHQSVLSSFEAEREARKTERQAARAAARSEVHARQAVDALIDDVTCEIFLPLLTSSPQLVIRSISLFNVPSPERASAAAPNPYVVLDVLECEGGAAASVLTPSLLATTNPVWERMELKLDLPARSVAAVSRAPLLRVRVYDQPPSSSPDKSGAPQGAGSGDTVEGEEGEDNELLGELEVRLEPGSATIERALKFKSQKLEAAAREAAARDAAAREAVRAQKVAEVEAAEAAATAAAINKVEAEAKAKWVAEEVAEAARIAEEAVEEASIAAKAREEAAAAVAVAKSTGDTEAARAAEEKASKTAEWASEEAAHAASATVAWERKVEEATAAKAAVNAQESAEANARAVKVAAEAALAAGSTPTDGGSSGSGEAGGTPTSADGVVGGEQTAARAQPFELLGLTYEVVERMERPPRAIPAATATATPPEASLPNSPVSVQEPRLLRRAKTANMRLQPAGGSDFITRSHHHDSSQPPRRRGSLDIAKFEAIAFAKSEEALAATEDLAYDAPQVSDESRHAFGEELVAA
jgi:hypothetical protein